MKICILAGEKSGDNYAALLCENLKRIKKDIFIFGTGGKEMEKKGVYIIKGMPFGSMGFTDVFKKIIKYLFFLKKLIRKIEIEKPDIVIFIDNPAFNLEVAKRLKKRFKSCYYIPPKIWAHNYKRVKILKKYIDFVIPIFPFECEIYKREKIKFFYFGHPFVDLVKEKKFNTKIKKEEAINIGLLPGSRKEEIKYNLPLMKKIIKNLNKKMGLEILISCADESFKIDIEKIFKDISYQIIEDLHFLIKNSDVVVAVSGTVNLEVAYFEKPMIIIYKTSFLNYFFAKFLVKLNMISPVNIFLGEKVFPEYIQNFEIERVTKDIIDLIEKKELYEREMAGFRKLKEILIWENVSENIANFIIKGEKFA
ncbi:MAG: lipid-A-disaccharide synthase [Candidatus Ratteibacteria bacterium]